MKKLLGILVLGLLVCSTANAKYFSDLIKPGMTKKQVQKLVDIGMKANWPLYRTYEIKALGGINVSVSAFCPYQNESNQYQYFPEYKTEVFTHTGINVSTLKGWPWYIFENVTKPIRCKKMGILGWGGGDAYKDSNGILKAVVWTKEEALILADPTYAKKVGERKKREEKERKKREEKERKRLAEEKKAAEEKRIAEEKKRKEEELKKLISKHGDNCEKKSSNQEGFEKDTPEFNNCLIVKEKERIKIEKEEAKRLKLEEEKLKNMKPQQRAEYKCINTFGFKKGADNYNDCLFKLYSVELELEKMKLEHEIQVQRLTLEREKLKTAKAQTEAAKAQAEAAYRSALANEEQAYQQRRSNAQRSINQGMRMLSGACTLGVNC